MACRASVKQLRYIKQTVVHRNKLRPTWTRSGRFVMFVYWRGYYSDNGTGTRIYRHFSNYFNGRGQYLKYKYSMPNISSLSREWLAGWSYWLLTGENSRAGIVSRGPITVESGAFSIAMC